MFLSVSERGQHKGNLVTLTGALSLSMEGTVAELIKAIKDHLAELALLKPMKDVFLGSHTSMMTILGDA